MVWCGVLCCVVLCCVVLCGVLCCSVQGNASQDTSHFKNHVAADIQRRDVSGFLENVEPLSGKPSAPPTVGQGLGRLRPAGERLEKAGGREGFPAWSAKSELRTEQSQARCVEPLCAKTAVCLAEDCPERAAAGNRFGDFAGRRAQRDEREVRRRRRSACENQPSIFGKSLHLVVVRESGRTVAWVRQTRSRRRRRRRRGSSEWMSAPASRSRNSHIRTSLAKRLGVRPAW